MPRFYKRKTDAVNEAAMRKTVREYLKDKSVCSLAGPAKKYNEHKMTLYFKIKKMKPVKYDL